MITRRPVTVTFRAARRLTWPATIEPGLLQRGPETHPNLFGPDQGSRRRFVVIDETVDGHCGDDIRRQLDRFRIDHNEPLLIPGGEKAKCQAVVDRIWAAMNEWGQPRFGEPTLIWGGGSLHDVVGFAAATYRRQTPYIMFGTTLVAAIDAMYALKVGISHLYKNRIGQYHPPIGAHADPKLFATLDHAQFLEGLGEILKVAVFMHAKLFRALELHGGRALNERFQGEDAGTLAILRYALAAMGTEISQNPYEHNPQRRSYGGHDISTGMEPEVTHGIAVALNTVWATLISCGRGLISVEQRDRILRLVSALDLPLWHPVLENVDRLAAALDEAARHRGGRQRVPVPGPRLGRPVFLDDISRDELIRALAGLHEFAG